MAGTNVFMNHTGVTVTPAGGSAIPVLEVTDVEPDRESRQEMFYGDARRFPRVIRNVEKKRTLKIMGASIAILASIPEDTPCTIVWILNDSLNGVGTGSGAITFTMVNAILGKNPYKGQNNKFAEGTVEFASFGDSADDDPLTSVIA